jgi:hypothetical protein
MDRHELDSNRPVRVGSLLVHVHDVQGTAVVSYIDENHIAYVFSSPRLSASELLQLLAASDLIGRTQQRLR